MFVVILMLKERRVVTVSMEMANIAVIGVIMVIMVLSSRCCGTSASLDGDTT